MKRSEIDAIEHGDVGSNQRLATVRKRLDEAQAIDTYYTALTEIKVQFDLAKTAPVSYPIDRCEMLIAQVSSSQPNRMVIEQLNKFGSKWSSRLPPGLKAAIKSLGYPYRGMTGDSQAMSWEDARAAISELSDSARALELEKQKEIAEAKEGLEQLRQRRRSPPMSPLTVLRRGLSWEGLETRVEPRRLGPLGQSPDVRRVFISYSHDTQSHVERVWSFAKQLRSDGVDCWMDQDTDNPDRGFPHWTERQVRFAQIVLVACSRGYRAKFDSEDGIDGGLGVKYEAHFIRQELYEKGLKNDKFLPVVFSEHSDDAVPALLRPYPRFNIPGDYRKLLDRIMGAGGGPNATLIGT